MEEVTKELPCAGKVTYYSAETAKGAATAADWQHGTSLKAYRCRHCDLWHLASVYKS